jgi:hypothetical protein
LDQHFQFPMSNSRNQTNKDIYIEVSHSP